MSSPVIYHDPSTTFDVFNREGVLVLSTSRLREARRLRKKLRGFILDSAGNERK